MPLKKLTETVFVSAQITLDELSEAKALGVTTVISNRPDGEEPGQLSADDMRTAAEAQGLTFVHIPIISGQVDLDAADRYGAALGAAEGKVLAFCRSGMRSTMLWALAEAPNHSVDELIATAGNAGFDLNPLAAVLADRTQG